MAAFKQSHQCSACRQLQVCAGGWVIGWLRVTCYLGMFRKHTADSDLRLREWVSGLCGLQEWVPGGELFHHLDIEGSFSDAAACFYAANVLLALECLHARGIVYRDLKPENLLLDTKVWMEWLQGSIQQCLFLSSTCKRTVSSTLLLRLASPAVLRSESVWVVWCQLIAWHALSAGLHQDG